MVSHTHTRMNCIDLFESAMEIEHRDQHDWLFIVKKCIECMLLVFSWCAFYVFNMLEYHQLQQSFLLLYWPNALVNYFGSVARVCFWLRWRHSLHPHQLLKKFNETMLTRSDTVHYRFAVYARFVLNYRFRPFDIFCACVALFGSVWMILFGRLIVRFSLHKLFRCFSLFDSVHRRRFFWVFHCLMQFIRMFFLGSI